MAKFTFKCVAMDETEYWTLPETDRAATALKFGIYIIRPDERVHICSFQASARGEWLENAFLMNEDYESPAWEAVSEMEHDNSGEYCSYFDWGSANGKKTEYYSETLSFEQNVREFKKPGESWRDAWISAADAAWEDAREYWSGNSPSIPILSNPALHLRNLAERRAKRLEPLPLFDLADVPAPAMLAPDAVFQALASAL